jgi:hypothetical protein
MMEFLTGEIEVRGKKYKVREPSASAGQRIYESEGTVRLMHLVASSIVDDDGKPVWTYEELKKLDPPSNWLAKMATSITDLVSGDGDEGN